MKDSRTITGDLMEEGVFVWCVFMPAGKASLHMNSEQYPDSRTHSRGRLLSPDVSVLHEILTPDDADRFLSLPEYGISIRIRMRLRYQGTEDRVVKQSEYEPEMCFPVWIVPQENGQVSLYLEEPSINQCAIQDITGLPGLPPDGMPVRAEMLIRRDGPFPEDRTCRGKKGGSGTGLMQEGISVWISFKAEEKAALYTQEQIRLAEEGYVPGRLLSPDISPQHEVYDWDSQYPWIRSKSRGWVRYRIRVRYPGTDDTGVEQSEYEPEACFPAWLVLKDGRTGLYLHEPADGRCLIPDMNGLPGLPGLKPDDAPVRVELLIRQSHWIFDLVDPALLKTGSCSGRLKPCLQEHPTLKK